MKITKKAVVKASTGVLMSVVLMSVVGCAKQQDESVENAAQNDRALVEQNALIAKQEASSKVANLKLQMQRDNEQIEVAKENLQATQERLDSANENLIEATNNLKDIILAPAENEAEEIF